MKALLKRFLLPQVSRDTSKTLAKAYEESHMTHLWEDTGKMYLLIETLKLTFESELGSVCYEKLGLEETQELLEQIRLGQTAAFRQKVVAGQPTEIRLSVCGLSWQTFNGTVRTRAVPDAAVLRAKDPTFFTSQAVFKHADRINDLEPGLLTLPNQVNVFTYEKITPAQFFEQIERINQRFKPDSTYQVNMNRENYHSVLTNNETLAIEKLTSQLSLPDDNSKS